MKQNILILFFAIININAIAQAPLVQWERSIGGSAVDQANSIARTSDSGYIVACVTASTDGDVTVNHGGFDCFIVKLSSWGGVVWKKSIGGSANDIPNTIKQTTDGGYIMACLSYSNDGDVTGNHGLQDCWVVKLDDTGRIQWQKSFGGSASDVADYVQQTTDGGYVVVGYTQSTDGDVTSNHGHKDAWVIKLDASGNIVWQKTYGGSDDDLATSVLQTQDGGYVLACISASTDGDVTGNHGGDDYWVVKLDDTGHIQWEQSYGGSGDEDDGDESYAGNIAQTFDGGFILTGTTDSYDGDVTGYHGGTFYDYWVLKISSVGALQWEQCYGGTSDDDGYSIQQTADTGYIVAGTSNSVDGDITHNLGTYDYWILKLSPTGTIVWQKNYGGSLDEYPYCIQITSDSEYIACGYSKSNDSDVTGNHGDYDGWVLKLAYCSLPNAGVISGTPIVCAGSGIVLSETVGGGTWSAGNGYGTVSGGIVTGVTSGTETILYSVTNSCGTGGATYTVTIEQLDPVITATGDTLTTSGSYNTYHWALNGAPIAGATNATHIATANGVYSVTVTDIYGCSGTSAADTIRGLGVSTVSNNAVIAVMPNPTTGMVYIKSAGSVEVRVYNIIGALLKEKNNTDNISIAEFSPGMYIIRLYDEQGYLTTQQKILKE